MDWWDGSEVNRHWLPRLMTSVQCLGPIVDSWELSSDLSMHCGMHLPKHMCTLSHALWHASTQAHMHTSMCTVACTHPNTCTHWYKINNSLKILMYDSVIDNSIVFHWFISLHTNCLLSFFMCAMDQIHGLTHARKCSTTELHACPES